MRLLLSFLFIVSLTVGQLDDPRGSVTCAGGILATVVGDSYCCMENGLLYCCKKSNPLICFTQPLVDNDEQSIDNEDETGPPIFGKSSPVKFGPTGPSQLKQMEDVQIPPSAINMTPGGLGPLQTAGLEKKQSFGQFSATLPDRSMVGADSKGSIDQNQVDTFENVPEDIGTANEEEEQCSDVKVHRSGLCTLRVTDSSMLRLVTLAFSQAEGCDSQTELSIRWANLEPGRDYQILFGNNPDCGAKNADAIEVARMEATARNGNVQVPSVVPRLREVKGKPVSLRVLPSGKTYACGTLTVFGL